MPRHPGWPAALLTAISTYAADGGPTLLGFFQGEAAKHNVEYMRYGDNCHLKEIGIQPFLIEGNLLTRGSSAAVQILAELRSVTWWI